VIACACAEWPRRSRPHASSIVRRRL
jgi:hypothetical protein